VAAIRLERRPDAWSDRARAYKVAVDDEVVGSVRRGEDRVFDVTPGRHRVRLHIDWARSEPVEVDVAEGAEVRLTCRGRNPLLALYFATVARNRYVVLERAEG
jgi:hypothetical protein